MQPRLDGRTHFPTCIIHNVHIFVVEPSDVGRLQINFIEARYRNIKVTRAVRDSFLLFSVNINQHAAE
jgi:hypothetical protein